MPRIRSISTGNDFITISDHLGVRTFDASTIPSSQNTITKVEKWLNTVGLPTITDGAYQIQVHVNSINPLSVSIITTNPGLVVSPNWWDRSLN